MNIIDLIDRKIKIKHEKKILEKEREEYHKSIVKKQKERDFKSLIAPTDCYIALNDINKIYPNHVQAVYNFNLKIQRHEFIVFVGPSGCGKSTTLRMIAGLEDITSGDLFIGGEYANDLTPKERDIAMVFQSYALYPHMTVKENMSFGLKINHYKKEEIEERVNKAAEILQLTEYLDRKPGALSGGQCQRVALGRAIVRNSNLFLMDEPLSNLDAKLRVQMRSEIVRLHQRLKATTIYVTHDQTEAMTMASRIVVMNKGYIQQIGTPKEIYNHPANMFVASFIGSPAMNLFDGTIKENKIILSNGFELECNVTLLDKLKNFYKNKIESLKVEIENYKNEYLSRNTSKISKLPKFENMNTAKIDNYLRRFSKKYEENIIKTLINSDQILSAYKCFIYKKIGENSLNYLVSITSYKDIEKEYQNIENQVNFDMLLSKDSMLSNKFNSLVKINRLLEKGEYKIIIGIRPEDVTVFKGNNGYNIGVSELLGSEYFLHIDFDDKKELVAKVSTNEHYLTGDSINISFNLDKIHYFDPITEESVF